MPVIVTSAEYLVKCSPMAPTSLLVASQRNLTYVRLAILPRIRKHSLWYWPAVTSIITYEVHDSVITDHQPLTSIFKRKTKSPRMNRWLLEMREYNYEIKYLKSKDNFVADHLSRRVRIIVRPAEISWLGLDKPEFMSKQREETVWG